MLQNMHRICWRVSRQPSADEQSVRLSLVFGGDARHGEEMPLDTVVDWPAHKDELGELSLSDTDRKLLALIMAQMVAGDEAAIMQADASIVVDAIHVVAAARFAKPVDLHLPAIADSFVSPTDYEPLDLVALPDDQEYPLAVLLSVESQVAQAVLLEDAKVGQTVVSKYNLVRVQPSDLRPAEFGNVFAPDDGYIN